MPRHAEVYYKTNRSLLQNQEPIRRKNCMNISFQLVLCIMKAKHQEDE